MGNIKKPVRGISLGYPFIKRVLSYVNELLGKRRNLTNRNRDCRITIESIKVDAEI